MGAYANNTNLAAKGILALRAFGELCSLVDPDDATCAGYVSTAQAHAATWEAMSYTEIDSPHYKMSFSARDSAYSVKCTYSPTFPKKVRVRSQTCLASCFTHLNY